MSDSDDSSQELERLIQQARKREKEEHPDSDDDSFSEGNSNDNAIIHKRPRKSFTDFISSIDSGKSAAERLLESDDDDEDTANVSPAKISARPVIRLEDVDDSSDEDNKPEATAVRRNITAQNQHIRNAQSMLKKIQKQQVRDQALEQQIQVQEIRELNRQAVLALQSFEISVKVAVQHVDSKQQENKGTAKFRVNQSTAILEVKRGLLQTFLKLPTTTSVDLWYRNKLLLDSDNIGKWKIQPPQTDLEATVYVTELGNTNAAEKPKKNKGNPISLTFRLDKQTLAINTFTGEAFSTIRDQLKSQFPVSSSCYFEFDGLKLPWTGTPESQDMENDDLVEIID